MKFDYTELQQGVRRFGMPVFSAVSALFIIVGAARFGLAVPQPASFDTEQSTSRTTGTAESMTSLTAGSETSRTIVRTPETLNRHPVPDAQQIDWKAPTGTQPNLADYTNLKVVVSLERQNVEILSNDTVIYTMTASTGLNDTTPHGDFTIGTRGTTFYNAEEKQGANWWTGFIKSTFLFHSVPIDADGKYIESEAEKLGSPASHGCVRLTVADARWFFEQVPTGTPVHIS